MVVSGSLWVCYGLLQGLPPVWLPNIPAVAFGAYYWHTFRANAPATFPMQKYYTGAGVCLAGIAGTVAALPAETAAFVLGLAGNAAVVAMFSGPLVAIKTVMDQRSTASLPLPMAVATFVNCSTWFAYGALVIHDPFIWFCNGLGLASAAAQLSLFYRFGIAQNGAPDASGDVDSAGPDVDEAVELVGASETSRVPTADAEPLTLTACAKAIPDILEGVAAAVKGMRAK